MHFINKSMEFQGPKLVEGILGFHWLAVLHHLRTAIRVKYDHLVTNLAVFTRPLLMHTDT
jgi:hypothetical protein